MFKKISIGGLLCCLMLIFLLSSQPAEVSSGYSRQMTTLGISIGEHFGLVAAGTVLDTRQMNALNNRFRQLAHSMAFFSLALSLGFTLKHMGFGLFKSLLLAFCIGAVLAGLDEWHQSFVPGRGMEWRDFRSDLQGITIGLALVGLTYTVQRRNGGQ